MRALFGLFKDINRSKASQVSGELPGTIPTAPPSVTLGDVWGNINHWVKTSCFCPSMWDTCTMRAWTNKRVNLSVEHCLAVLGHLFCVHGFSNFNVNRHPSSCVPLSIFYLAAELSTSLGSHRFSIFPCAKRAAGII